MRAPKVTNVSLKGGLDLSRPASSVGPGYALHAKNYEPELNGGYRRVDGYERFDGRTKPSDAVYYTLVVDDSSGESAPSSITGGTSGATANVVIIDNDTNTLGITNVSGTFVDGETVGSTTVDGAATLSGQTDATTSATWELAAQDYYRGLIAVPTGSGSILGVTQHRNAAYCFRANAGGTAVDMWKSTTSGWSQITFFRVMFFDTGVYNETDIAVGDTLDGATSSAQGTVKAIVKNAGSYGSTAEGYVVIDVTSGTFQSGEAIQESAVTRFTSTSTADAITFDTGGRFEFVSHNFYGQDATYNLYGCDGVNPAFEFDGTILTPIYFPSDNPSGTTATDEPEFNKPKYIAAHNTHLFLACPGGSLQHSIPGTPTIFSGFLGSTEFGLGSDITGLSSQSGSVLAAYTRRKTYGLYGKNVSDWELKVLSEKSGALDYTARTIGTTYALDDTGITRLDRVEAFGNFEAATVSRMIRTLIAEKKSLLIGAETSRSRNQYRLYFSDGTGIVMGEDNYIGADNEPAFTQLEFDDPVTCISNNEDENGNEIILFGSTDGMVYQAEKGNSNDGALMESVLRVPFNLIGSPRLRKAFKYLALDLEADRQVSLLIHTELSYGSSDTLSNVGETLSTVGGGGRWDESEWDDFYWDAQQIAAGEIPLTGTGTSISFIFYQDSAITKPFTLQALHIHYQPRRIQRG